MAQEAKITEFQKAEVGDTILAKKYGKKLKGVVTRKHPGAVVVEIDGDLQVVDADRIIKCYKKRK